MFRRIPRPSVPMMLTLLTVLALSTISAPGAGAATYIINPGGTGDFPTIQAAINAAVAGDRIQLVDGIFNGPGNWDLSFLGKAITVESRYGNPNNCIIDCADVGTAHRGVSFAGEGPGSMLRGIMIRNGHASAGGGVYMNGASPTIVSCSFTYCTASTYGGGAYVNEGTPVFSYCYFELCEAQQGGGAYVSDVTEPILFSGGGFLNNQAQSGGGLLVDLAAEVSLVNVAFAGNTAFTNGGGLLARDHAIVRAEDSIFQNGNAGAGAGIFVDATSLSLEHCWVEDNHATNCGAGLWCQNGSTPVIEWTVIARNTTPGYGGGLHCWASSPVIRDCTFYANAGTNHAGGISIEQCGLSIERTIIAASTQGEAVHCYQPGSIQISCTDIYGNVGGDWTSYISPLQNQNGNIQLDPQFCHPETGDLTIRRSSPCAPFTPPNPQCDLIGACGVGCPVSSADEDAALDDGRPMLHVEPNPFRGATRIGFGAAGHAAGHATADAVGSATRDESVRISIFDGTGRLVRELHSGPVAGGALETTWDGRNDAGIPVAAGVYLVRAQQPAGAITRSVVLLR